jgi:hypothetical protein
MLTHLDPAPALAVSLLIFTPAMVMMFEATNGFHDAADAVATVIYTKSLEPTRAVVWSGVVNFLGVLFGVLPQLTLWLSYYRPRCRLLRPVVLPSPCSSPCWRPRCSGIF